MDAYQALVDGTIPYSSKLLTDEKYFNYVVGSEITEEVKQAVRRKTPRIVCRIE